MICTLVMALRVLLADESSTIKKAMQMALSDFGVEVKSVPSGLDVLSVSHTFKPDIVFADILLTKKNGYEVCNELKTDLQTKNIPVVLMWSSFMQLDRNQFQKVKADGSLEKPFDSEALRSLIEKFVDKVNTFPLKGFLNHPDLPDFEESNTFVRQRSEVSSQAPHKDKNTPLIEEIEDEFSIGNHSAKIPEADDWSTNSNGQFIVETESMGDFEEVTVVNARGTSSPDLQKRIQEQVSTYLENSPVAQSKQQQTLAGRVNQGSALSNLDEQLLREEVRQMAEKICWQVIPEITEKIVREELGKLLKDIEKSV
ncbi:MAG: response regulator [Bdellovibrio sp.]|nr:response regulator [Bdellovibrio sp.]